MATTIYDIADKAGVSVATVSKVMNSRKGVNSKTARRISDVMEQMQFRPRWKASSVQTIALVVFPTPGWLSSTYQADLVSGLTENLFDAGYCVQIISCNADSRSLENINRLIITHQIQGVVVLASPKIYSIGMEIGKLDYPHVIIGNMPVFEGNCNISVKHFDGRYQAGQYLWRLGHRKFGIVMPSTEDVGHRARKDGALKAINDNGGNVNDVKILEYPD
ncbi:MAG: LacI family DNA-binding transcriptional regulator [Smithellaceae bacterium]|nr:LacI family DNA-binding transcriptional regulator [Smithellaceae bacterium]